MGTIRNRMMIIFHWNFDEIKEVHEDAIKCWGHLWTTMEMIMMLRKI